MATEKSIILVIRSARPAFKNNHDRIAFAVHSAFLSEGYILTATGLPAFSDSAFTSPSSDEVGIEGWNTRDGEYAFVYANPEMNSKKVLVKCLAMNDKLLVDALEQGGSEPVHLEISVADYVRDEQSSNYAMQYRGLDELVKSLDKGIFSRLRKVEPKSDTDSMLDSVFSHGAHYVSSSQVRERSELPYQPEHGHSEGRGTSPYGFLFPPVPVDPSGFSDVLPGLPAGVYPARGRDPGGSMLIGPNDPRWVGGPGGGPGFLDRQPPGVPPGARFDPFGPPDVPGFEPDRFVRQPRSPGGPPHPDLQHFPGGSDFI